MAISEALSEAAFPVASGLVFGAIGLFVLSGNVSKFRGWLAMRGSEPVTVAEAARTDGPVEVEGVARAHEETITTPFSANDCFVCTYWVHVPSSSQGSTWSLHDSGTLSVPFRVEDRTGSLLVDPTNAETFFAGGWEDISSVGESPPAHIVEGTERVGIASSASEGKSLGPISVESPGPKTEAKMTQRRYRDSWLAPDQTVHVFGPIEHDPSASRSGQSGEVNAVIRDTGDVPFVVSNTNWSETVARMRSEGLEGVGLGLVISLIALGLVGWGLQIFLTAL